MDGNRRRKKRHTHGLKTVELTRGKAGYGFTISGNHPCILSCVVPSTPADRVGLRTGDYLLAVNNQNVSHAEHDDVVRLIGSSTGKLILQIAENYSLSGSSDEEVCEKNKIIKAPSTRAMTNHNDKENYFINDEFLSQNSGSSKEDFGGHRCRRVIHSSKEGKKHTIITRQDRLAPRAYPEFREDYNEDNVDEAYHSNVINFSNQVNDLSAIFYPSLEERSFYEIEDTDNSPPNCQVLVGYIGSIEMPQDAINAASSRMQSIRNALRRLRIESKVHTLVVIEVDSIGVCLKNAMRQIMVTYPAENIAYSGCCPDDKRFFGIVTVTQSNNYDTKILNNSCHAFMIDPDLRSHTAHMQKAKTFGINCVQDGRTRRCLQFPKSAAPILKEILKLYKRRQSNLLGNEKASSIRSLGSFTTDSTESSSGFTSSQQSHNRLYFKSNIMNDDSSHNNNKAGNRGTESAFLHHNKSTSINPVDLDAQNSADNLRRNALKMMQNRIQQDNLTDSESVRSFDTRSQTSSQRSQSSTTGDINNHRQEAPPLPPKNTIIPKLPPKPSSLGQKPPLPERKPFIPPRRPMTPPPIIHSRSHSTPPRLTDETSNIQRRINSEDSADFNEQHKDSKHFQKANSFKIAKSKKKLSLSNSHESLVSEEKLKEQTPIKTSGSDQSISKLDGRLMTGFYTPSEELGKVASWAIGFDKLLSDDDGMKTFTKFLEKEYSDENIIFWKKCEFYKNIINDNERKTEAEEIYDKHLSTTATLPINVDSFARQIITDGIRESTVATDLFNIPQKQIYSLMKQDSYPRFIKSEMYRHCVVADMQNKPLPTSGPAPPTPTSSYGLKRTNDGKKTKSITGSYTSVKEEETKRRRSLLPWTKSKSEKKLIKDKISSDSKSDISILTKQNDNDANSLKYGASPRTSIASLEKQKYCRIVLPDRSTTVLDSQTEESIYKSVCYVCDRRKIELAAFEAYEFGSEKSLDLNLPLNQFASKEIRIEEYLTFTLCMHNGKVVGVRGRATKCIKDTLRPILLKFGIKLDGSAIHILDSNNLLDHNTLLTAINGKTVLVETMDDFAEWGGGFHRFTAPSTGKNVGTATQMETRRITFELEQLKNGQSINLPEFDEFGIMTTTIKRGRPPKDSGGGGGGKREGRQSVGGFLGFFRRTSMEPNELVKENKTTKVRHNSQKFASLKQAFIMGKDKKSKESLHVVEDNKNLFERKLIPRNDTGMFDMIENIQSKKINDQCVSSQFESAPRLDMPEFLKTEDDNDRNKLSPASLRRTESDTSIMLMNNNNHLINSPTSSLHSLANDENSSFSSNLQPTPKTAHKFFNRRSFSTSPNFKQTTLQQQFTDYPSSIGRDTEGFENKSCSESEKFIKNSQLNISELETTLQEDEVALKDSTMTMIELEDGENVNYNNEDDENNSRLTPPPPSPNTSNNSPPPCELTTHMLSLPNGSFELTDSSCII